MITTILYVDIPLLPSYDKPVEDYHHHKLAVIIYGQVLMSQYKITANLHSSNLLSGNSNDLP